MKVKPPAIVEWEFPKEIIAQAPPVQRQIVNDPRFDRFDGVFDRAGDDGVNDRVEHHATSVWRAYLAGGGAPPFLLNFVTETPQAMEMLIELGTRVFSFSSASRSDIPELEAVIKKHPDVLFIVSTPHIAGNSVSTWDLNEVPSRYALQYKNVVFAGALEFNLDHENAHHDRKRLGTRKNPFYIDNQPAKGARQYYMASTGSSGLRGTSAAAPVLARLAEMATQKLIERGIKPTSETIIRALDSVMEKGFGTQKDGTTERIDFFTLDTVLLNAGRPLVTEKIWRGLKGMPPPRELRIT